MMDHSKIKNGQIYWLIDETFVIQVRIVEDGDYKNMTILKIIYTPRDVSIYYKVGELITLMPENNLFRPGIDDRELIKHLFLHKENK